MLTYHNKFESLYWNGNVSAVAIQLTRFSELISGSMSYIFINSISHWGPQKWSECILVLIYLNEWDDFVGNNVSVADDWAAIPTLLSVR